MATNPYSPVARLDIANDDASVARRIAEEYKASGIDPVMAYDDPEAALQDFDLKQYGL